VALLPPPDDEQAATLLPIATMAIPTATLRIT